MAGWGRCKYCHEDIWWGVSPYDSDRAFPFDDEDEEQPHFETCSARDRVQDDYGEWHTTSRCRACGARVWWETTVNDRRRPMDCDGSHAEDTVHFETCRGERASSVSGRRQERARQEEEARARQERQEQEARAKQTREEADRQRRQRYRTDGAPYEIRLWLPDLELSWPCKRADIVSAFRRLAMVHHPDMGGDASEFIRIKLAYDRLKQLLPEEKAA